MPRSSLQVSEEDLEDYPGARLRGAFEFKTLTNMVLPQLVYDCNFGSEIGPAAWSENNFYLYRKRK